MDQIAKPLTLVHDVKVGFVNTLRSLFSMYPLDYSRELLPVTFIPGEHPTEASVLSLAPSTHFGKGINDDRRVIILMGAIPHLTTYVAVVCRDTLDKRPSFW